MVFTVVAVDIKSTTALSNVVVLRAVDESTSVTDSVILATVPTEAETVCGSVLDLRSKGDVVLENVLGEPGVVMLVVGGSVLGSLVDSR